VSGKAGQAARRGTMSNQQAPANARAGPWRGADADADAAAAARSALMGMRLGR
jgi:hypothetical protein